MSCDQAYDHAKGITLMPLHVVRPDKNGTIVPLLQVEAVRSFSFSMFQSEVFAGKNKSLNDSQLART